MTRSLLFLFMFLNISSLQAKPNLKVLTFAGYENPPFYMRDGAVGITGAFFEIMNQVCNLENISCKFTIRPFRDALELVKTGDSQASGPFGWTQQRDQAFYFSPPLFEARHVFFGLEKNTKNIKSYEDLRGLRVGAVGPSLALVNLQKINETLNGDIKIIYEKEPLTALRLAMQNSYALVFTNRDLGRYWIREKKANLQEVSSLGENFNIFILFSKKVISKPDFERFNKRIHQLIADKTVEKIAYKYQLTVAK